MHELVDGSSITLPIGVTATNVFVKGLNAMGVAGGDEVTLTYKFCTTITIAKANADAAGRVEWPVTIPAGGGEMNFSVDDSLGINPLIEGKMEFVHAAAPPAPTTPQTQATLVPAAVVPPTPPTETASKSYLWLWIVGGVVLVLGAGCIFFAGMGALIHYVPSSSQADATQITASDKQASASTQTGTSAPTVQEQTATTAKPETILGPHSNKRTPEQKRVALCERCARWINKPPSCSVCSP